LIERYRSRFEVKPAGFTLLELLSSAAQFGTNGINYRATKAAS
jgi:hypothetical protein